MSEKNRISDLAKVLREHRRCRAVNFGDYECVCGEPVASNSHHVMSAHQAEKVAEYFASIQPAPVESKPNAEELIDVRAAFERAEQQVKRVRDIATEAKRHDIHMQWIAPEAIIEALDAERLEQEKAAEL